LDKIQYVHKSTTLSLCEAFALSCSLRISVKIEKAL
jgi:hypothetical protein